MQCVSQDKTCAHQFEFTNANFEFFYCRQCLTEINQ
jgi:hypothetical protein